MHYGSNAFWHNLLKIVIHSFQTSTTSMASVSQNLPRTFYKLAEKWDNKVLTRTFESNCWTPTSCDLRDPIYKVASIMSPKLGAMTCQTLKGVLVDEVCLKTPEDQVWIYDMRQSDTLPKTPADSKRLYKYVETLVMFEFDTKEAYYLMDHVHITTCFFVWYFTKPNFFFKDKVMRQTTRNGIQRVWTPILLNKKPKPQVETIAVSIPKIATTTDALLPKQQQQQAKLQKDIQDLMSLATAMKQTNIDWSDPLRVHLRVSEFIANSESGLSIKQNKKLQKIYNEYTTITKKINKTIDKINKVERANAKIAFVPPISTAHDDDELGPEPLSPPQLIRQSADELGYEGTGSTDIKCFGCESNQPNQLAHIGGCLPDELYGFTHGDEAEDEVPDSWEDL